MGIADVGYRRNLWRWPAALSTLLVLLTLVTPGPAAAEAQPGTKAGRSKRSHPVPTKTRGPVRCKDGKIASRVLPYPDFVSLFIRSPIAHAVALGEGVRVAVVRSAGRDDVGSTIESVAPGCTVQVLRVGQGEAAVEKLAGDIVKSGSSIAVVPDIDKWSERAALGLAERLIKARVAVLVPSDLSDDTPRIALMNRLQAMGVITVGRVDRQSLVMQQGGSGRDRQPFNRRIREIRTDVFSTVGMFTDRSATKPVAAAAGVAALVLEKWPKLTPAEVRQRILAGARSAWQATSVETGRWARPSVDPVTTEYKPIDEKTVFRFKVLDAAGSLQIDTEIPWFLNMLNCHKVWEITRGEGIVAVVTDQGFHLQHPELAGRVKTTAQFGPHSLKDPNQNFHGTDMSRILLAVAPQAEIIPVLCSAGRTADREKHLKSLGENIARSFEYAAEQKADVVSASWAGYFNKHAPLLSAVRSTVDSGTVVSWFHYPEPYPGLIRSSFIYSGLRSGGRSIGFADRFLTSDPPGFHPVEIEAGLSGTAPQAAGIAALAKSVNKRLTPRRIEELIHQHCTPIGNGIRIPDAYEIVIAAKEAGK